MASLECAASDGALEQPPPAGEPHVCHELRMVLVGKTGTGRSSSGNSIVGRDAFRTDVSPRSVTTRCQRETATRHGRNISVVDTPGFFNSRLSALEVTAEVGRCVALSPPGPHTFLVTLQVGRFTQEERDTLEWLKATFGPAVTRFALVLFTGGDQLKEKSIGDFLEESDELLAFVKSCMGGFHVLDNSSGGQDQATGESKQVVQLLEKVDKMVAENGGRCYCGEMLQEAERAIREVQKRILGEGGDGGVESLEGPTEEKLGTELERRRREEEEEARKRAEKLFWYELATALGRGAAEGAGIMGKDKGKGKVLKKTKVVEKAAALATTPLSISSAAKAVGGAVREGSKIIYKHRKTLLK